MVGAIAGAMLIPDAGAQGGELRILCSNGIRAALQQLTPDIEKAIGRKLSIEFSTSTGLGKEIEGGAPFDLAIATPVVIDALAKSGRLVAGSETVLATADLGVGVKAGSPKTDISTPEGMKRRLLAAKSLTWTIGGASNDAILAMFKGLGIENELKSKIVLQKTSGRPAESVAEGENELMFAPVSEILAVKGLEVLGMFPKEFQQPLIMTAAISARSKDAVAAYGVIGFLVSTRAMPAITAAGMTPAPRN